MIERGRGGKEAHKRIHKEKKISNKQEGLEGERSRLQGVREKRKGSKRQEERKGG